MSGNFFHGEGTPYTLQILEEKCLSLALNQITIPRQSNTESRHCPSSYVYLSYLFPECLKKQCISDVCIYRFQNVVLRCPTPRLHSFYLPIGLHLGFFRSWPTLYLPSSFSLVYLMLSFVSASPLMLFWVIFLLPFFGHGRTI